MDIAFYMGFSDMLQTDGVDKTLEFAKQKGFNAVEFLARADGIETGNIKSLSQAEQLAQKLKENGLKTACYSVYACLLDEQTEENLMRHVEIAHVLGSPYLHHTIVPWLAFPPNAPSYEDVLNQVLARAERVARYCEKFSIRCLYEGQGMYFNGVEGMRGFFEEMKKRGLHVGLCGDFGNTMFVDEPAKDFFKAFAKDIYHVHLKDYKIIKKSELKEPCNYQTKGGDYLKDVPFGTGDVDFTACLERLKEVGYTGAYAFENESLSDIEHDVAFFQTKQNEIKL